MGLADACRPSAGGVHLEVEVVPGASRPGFPTGYNPWRRRIQARVEAPPQDGAANRELAERVAGFFGRKPAEVSVVAGHASRQKTVAVAGLTPTDAIARLAAAGVKA